MVLCVPILFPVGILFLARPSDRCLIPPCSNAAEAASSSTRWQWRARALRRGESSPSSSAPTAPPALVRLAHNDRRAERDVRSPRQTGRSAGCASLSARTVASCLSADPAAAAATPRPSAFTLVGSGSIMARSSLPSRTKAQHLTLRMSIWPTRAGCAPGRTTADQGGAGLVSGRRGGRRLRGAAAYVHSIFPAPLRGVSGVRHESGDILSRIHFLSVERERHQGSDDAILSASARAAPAALAAVGEQSARLGADQPLQPLYRPIATRCRRCHPLLRRMLRHSSS